VFHLSERNPTRVLFPRIFGATLLDTRSSNKPKT
jgi:hypothetical protein